MNRVSVLERQRPQRVIYKIESSAAMVTDHARTAGEDITDPFHFTAEPTDGCAALAACQESTVRMVAKLLGIELEAIEVQVTGEVGVRGTPAMDPNVPVGFQIMNVRVRLQARPETRPELLEKLRVNAERSCEVLQTLRNSTPVHLAFETSAGETCLQAVDRQAVSSLTC